MTNLSGKQSGSQVKTGVRWYPVVYIVNLRRNFDEMFKGNGLAHLTNCWECHDKIHGIKTQSSTCTLKNGMHISLYTIGQHYIKEPVSIIRLK